MEPLAQTGCINKPSVGHSSSICSKWTCRRSPLNNKLAQGLFLSLSLSVNQGATAFSFAPRNSMPDWVAKGAAANPRSIPANTTAESPSDLTPIQLIVTNGCSESIWPGILTQNGTGPGTGGFELTPGNSRLMFVSSNWGGRVWGRTNCGSFSGDGSGHRTSNGVDGDKTACLTGDCIGKLNCTLAGRAPATVAEFTLQGGSNNNQTFYDISLVDGYNLPMAIIYHPSPNTTWIPPNLTNCACIASAGYLSPSPYFSPSASPDSPSDLNTNSTYPMPFEPMQTDNTVQGWCPVPLQVPAPNPATAPAAGDNTTTTITTTPSPVTGNTGNPLPVPSHRPPFQPCLSPCAATRNPSDCCTGPYNSPDTCEPSRYSHGAKRVCPDAYSFAYDDGASTFVVPHEPAGAGWEVRFCPRGRSTDILRAFGDEVRAVGAGTGLSAEGWERVRSWEYVEEKETGWTAGGVVVGRGGGGAWIAVLGAVAVMVWIAG